MNSKGRGVRRKRLRKWLKRLALFCLLAPVLAVLLANLILATSWGTGLVSKRITQRSGLPCEIERISWWPWSGASVHGVRLKSPESEEVDFLTIAEIEINPSWKSIFSGKKRFETLEVRQVRGSISLEQLSDLFGARPTQPENAPTPVTEDPPPLAEAQDPPPDPPVAQADPVPQKTPVAAPVSKSKTPAPPVIPVDDFQGSVLFSDVDLELYSEKTPELSVSLTGISGELPVWGETRSGSVEISSVLLAGEYEEREISLPVEWDDRYLQVKGHPMKLFGLNLYFTTALRLVPGLPVGIQIDVPAQQMDLSPLTDKKSPIALRSLTSTNLLQGYLLYPLGISGRSHTTFQDLVIQDPRDGSRRTFERGNLTAIMTSAGIVVRDARALGEEEAILANGYLTTSGEMAGTVRIVASPERAQNHQNRVARAGLDFAFTNLNTPDRLYRDLRLEDREGTIMIDLGPEEQWVPLFPAARAIMKGGPSGPSILP